MFCESFAGCWWILGFKHPAITWTPAGSPGQDLPLVHSFGTESQLCNLPKQTNLNQNFKKTTQKYTSSKTPIQFIYSETSKKCRVRKHLPQKSLHKLEKSPQNIPPQLPPLSPPKSGSSTNVPSTPGGWSARDASSESLGRCFWGNTKKGPHCGFRGGRF